MISTWNGEYWRPRYFMLKNFLNDFLSDRVPQYGSTFKAGQKVSISRFQLCRVVAGVTTKNGPQIFLFSVRCASSEIA